MEQMLGVARVGDLTLLWVVLALFVALPSGMAESDIRPAEKPARSRAMSSRSSGWKAAIGSVVVVFVVFTIWAKNVNYVRADALAASARTEATEDFRVASSSLSRAIGLAPDVPDYYWCRAELLASMLFQVEDSESRAELEERMYADLWQAAQISPISHQAKLKLAGASMILARLDYEGKDQEAIRRLAELVELAPALGEFHNLLAIAYIESGQPREGVRVLEELLSMEQQPAVHSKALYLKGVAHKELAQNSLAIQALEAAFQLQAPQDFLKEVQRLLSQLMQESIGRASQENS